MKLLNLSVWTTLLNYCPELEFKSNPKDRSFFYNVLNTIKPNCVDKIVRNALIYRQNPSKIRGSHKKWWHACATPCAAHGQVSLRTTSWNCCVRVTRAASSQSRVSSLYTPSSKIAHISRFLLRGDEFSEKFWLVARARRVQ